MKKSYERPNHNRLDEQMVINMFLSYKNVVGKADYTQHFPDCIVSSDKLCIEETSVRSYESKFLYKKSYSKGEYHKALELKSKAKNQEEICNFLVHKIEAAIEQKEGKNSYLGLIRKYNERVLLIRISDPFFNWRANLEKVSSLVNIFNLKLKIFNSIYLVAYPIRPTKKDIDDGTHSQLRSDFIPIIDNFTSNRP